MEGGSAGRRKSMKNYPPALPGCGILADFPAYINKRTFVVYHTGISKCSLTKKA
jgi:hypothetical protein